MSQREKCVSSIVNCWNCSLDRKSVCTCLSLPSAYCLFLFRNKLNKLVVNCSSQKQLEWSSSVELTQVSWCVCLVLFSSLFHRETHAEDRSPAAGLHVLKLHVAEDESGRSAFQVRRKAAGKSYRRDNHSYRGDNQASGSRASARCAPHSMKSKTPIVTQCSVPVFVSSTQCDFMADVQ